MSTIGPLVAIHRVNTEIDRLQKQQADTMTTRQFPPRSESTCSIMASTSRCTVASPVLCISTATAISKVYAATRSILKCG